MTKVPTLKTLTLRDIALIGCYLDEYMETYRSPDRRNTEGYQAYLAARYLVAGCPGFWDAELIKKHYSAKVLKCFTKKGTLDHTVKINVYKN